MDGTRFREAPIYLRPYTLSTSFFLVLYAITGWIFPSLVATAFVTGLLYMSTFWSIRSRLIQCYFKDPKGAFVLYKKSLCQLKKERVGNHTYETFMFMNRKFILKDGNAVEVAPDTGFTFQQFQKGVSHSLYNLFPPNEIKLPNPSFSTLFKEQCVTPLFCFQIFSSLLLCFDEYVLQGLFSTAIIIFVEATLVFSRFATISKFRSFENAKQTVLLSGSGNVDSSVLRPGDEIEIPEPISVPCDLLVLSGSCAASEAMLSGESVPLPKEAIPNTPEFLEMSKHKKHILFGGTKIEKIYSPMRCCVLRTGFSTEQGQLLSGMIGAEDVKYDPEALRFIILLSLVSLFGSVFTFFNSSKSGYPLFIDIIVLFTSSIPFELPMEMSVAVQNAVRRLATKQIFCLEPFRITMAGKVDVCCFDKTGTLTEAELSVRGVVQRSGETARVLACCNGLVEVDGSLRGDPIDCAIADYITREMPKYKSLSGFKILKQFAFSSDLKRQGVIAEFEEGGKLFAVKGAPEVIKKLLKQAPVEYDKYLEYAGEGHRVIALACKPVTAAGLSRAAYEKELEFAGFVLLSSTLRKYAKEMCAELAASGHRLLMITGDNRLTANFVASDVGIPLKGVEGAGIDQLLKNGSDEEFLETRVFARADPSHKEEIIKRYKCLGFHTMMVGDGTNDVGALKAADIGIAMLGSKEAGPVAAPAPAQKRPRTLLEAFSMDNSVGSTKPGDASVAAPFTVRSDSLKAITEIILQGRTSLVTTIQMYKILALNSLVNLFFTALVDILGVKFSEVQMFSVGVLSAIAYQAISNGRPLATISKDRPLVTIFSRYVILSILGQALVQIGALSLIFKWVPRPAPALKFQPSEMATVLYVISCIQTVSAILCNYIGRPFRENISENLLVCISIAGLFGFVLNVVFGFHKELNDMLEVMNVAKYTPMLIAVIAGLFLFSYLVERVCFRAFMLHNK